MVERNIRARLVVATLTFTLCLAIPAIIRTTEESMKAAFETNGTISLDSLIDLHEMLWAIQCIWLPIAIVATVLIAVLSRTTSIYSIWSRVGRFIPIWLMIGILIVQLYLSFVLLLNS